MKYSISLKNHLSALNGAIIFTILLFVTVLLIGINKGFDDDLFYYFTIFYLTRSQGYVQFRRGWWRFAIATF